jgi:hypothetical protein
MQANLIPAKLNAVRDRLPTGTGGPCSRSKELARDPRQNHHRKVFLAICMAALCAAASGLGGCEHHVVHAAVSKMVPPTPIVNEAGPPPEIHPDDSNAEMLAFLTPSEPIAPAEPVHATPPAHHTETTPRPTAPQISQQISPADEAVYKQRTESAIAIAEKNLRQAAGKQLNTSQRDMVEKIEAFVSQSREALSGSDWTRAQNLAQKAEVLSTELANSL